MFDRILVVCTGNICRSPVGAALLKQRLPGKRIESAGLGAMVDKPAEPLAMALAADCTDDLGSHKARQLKPDMLQDVDLVLVMTDKQRRAIADQNPALTGKIMLYGQWLKNRQTGEQGIDIPDPYRKSREAFEHVHNLLTEAADTWKTRL